MVRNSDMDRAGPEKDYLRSRTQTQAGIPVKQCLKLSCLNENWSNFGVSSETPISNFFKIHPTVFQLKYVEEKIYQTSKHVGYAHVATKQTM